MEGSAPLATVEYGQLKASQGFSGSRGSHGILSVHYGYFFPDSYRMLCSLLLFLLTKLVFKDDWQPLGSCCAVDGL